MDEATIEKFIATISERVLILEKNQLEVKAAVTVLKGLAVFEINPSDPLEVAEHIRNLEKTLLNSDPRHQELEEILEIVEALKAVRGQDGAIHEA
jgi:hypothetical protein